MPRSWRPVVLAGVQVLLCGVAVAIAVLYPEPCPYQDRLYLGPGGARMPYRLLVPADYDPHKSYPLVVWLHGSDAIGSDNRMQISGYNTAGTQVWTDPDNRKRFPTIVVAPQSAERSWSMLLKQQTVGERSLFELIAALQKEFHIDPDRIYLTGQSMGGFGVWALLARRPDLFAAGVVLCGPAVHQAVARTPQIPVWVFHGAKDDVVLVGDARNMVEGLRKAGGHPRYTEYANLGHLVGPAAFNETELLPWLFRQKRVARSIPDSPFGW